MTTGKMLGLFTIDCDLIPSLITNYTISYYKIAYSRDILYLYHGIPSTKSV